MTPTQPPRVAERRRERDVFLLYGAAFRDLPQIDRPNPAHVPRACADSTLVALAQLVATRLQAQCACISLIDNKHQHFIAEATPTSSLRPEPEDASALWLGSVSVPRRWGVCEQVLELRGEQAALVINDLSQCERHAQLDFVKDGPQWRFYAGVPLVSPSGTVVGVLSVWDDRPRSGTGLTPDDFRLLEDFAVTVVKYLDTYTIREQYQRGEQFTRGLLSFAQGASALRPFKVFTDDGSNLSGTTSAGSGRTIQSFQPSSMGSRTIQAVSSSNDRSIGTLQNSILPPNSRDMFSRAANVMMASSNLDGVLILDASVAATGHRQFPGNHDDEDDSAEDSSQSKSSSSDDGSTQSSGQEIPEMKSPKKCSVLGYALKRKPQVSSPGKADGSEFGSLSERDLARLFKEWPMGKIMNFTATGASVSSNDDTSSSSTSAAEETPSGTKRKETSRRIRTSTAIHGMLPNARSVAFIPFWDYVRFLRPKRLHLVLISTLEFIKDTALDSFQSSMLNSLHSCGQTLLDTINQVMDYSKSNETGKTVSSRKLKSSNTLRLSSKPLKTRKIKQSAFDLSMATEEVVEAVFSGCLYIPILGSDESVASSSAPEDDPMFTVEPSSNRKTCYIVLEIAEENDWIRCFPVGAWKRIVMNLFGNAVKYTQSGHIHVSLRVNDSPQDQDNTTTITLTIKDSGTGMSPSFLANHAFQPFSQENPHSPGVGLGLSIVRQIIETSGGKMEVSSEPAIGTNFTVKLALTKPDVPQSPVLRKTEFLVAVSRLSGRRICILHKKHISPSESSEAFGNMVQTEEWTGHDADFVICPEPSFEYLEAIRRWRVNAERAPVTIFVAMDALEAATFRSDVRVQNKESVVEIMTQPCGPYKLSYILNRCIDRFDDSSENIQKSNTSDRLLPPSHLETSGSRSQGSPAIPPSLPTTETTVSHVALESLRQSPSIEPSSLKSTVSAIILPVAESPPLAKSPPPGESPPLAEDPPVELKDVLPIRTKSTEPHVLVTDDNAINRKVDIIVAGSLLVKPANIIQLLTAFLRKHKWAYSEAENGLEALQSYQDPFVRYDYVLMDMSMPVMDGMTATRAIRQYEQTYNISRCCIVALTGLASNSARLEAWNSGIDHYMTKPVNFKKLAEFLGSEKERRSNAKDE
ncbi:hypothetical protein N0V90_001863 [Kalmusia sp. IMI 367209]|nr:hypothetical protein N0V90_001863 [Kalmusia sp. IMI 367209]